MIRLCLLLLLTPNIAQAACRQALSLALDVSSSVDDREYRLQLNGIMAALNAQSVKDILFAQPQAPIRVHVYEWSEPSYQNVIVPWTDLQTPADLAQVTTGLRRHRRETTGTSTAIGAALLAGFAFLEQQPTCWKHTLDISGDGENNTGIPPQSVTSAIRPVGMTVNGLVIGAGDLDGDDETFVDIKQLTSYYRANVIGGPGAFIEVALGYEAYAAAMERKLLRELAHIAIGQADVPATAPPHN